MMKLNLFALAGALALAPTSASAMDPEMARVVEMNQRANEEDSRGCSMGKEIAIGWRAKDVAEAWCMPYRINETETAAGTRRQWIYPDYPRSRYIKEGRRIYLYFDINGILTTIQRPR